MQVDNMVNNILLNTANNYPQAPPSGGTPRMRQVITDVNRSDNPDNDLIFSSGIKISDYVKINTAKKSSVKDIEPVKGDYTGLIMEVINKAIVVTQDNSQDGKERTIF